MLMLEKLIEILRVLERSIYLLILIAGISYLLSTGVPTEVCLAILGVSGVSTANHIASRRRVGGAGGGRSWTTGEPLSQ